MFRSEKKQLKKLSLLTATVLLLCACSFNKLYYAPAKIPATVKRVRMVDKETGDTVFIRFKNAFTDPVFETKDSTARKMPYIIHSLAVESSSGNKIHTWKISPNGIPVEATILFFHGNGGNVLMQYPGLIPLVKKGFRIWIFDYSGYGFSEGKASRKNVLKDANAVFQKVLSEEGVPGQRTRPLIIYGQSLGGHLATVVAEQNQQMIDGLVVEGAFSSHKDIAARSAGIFGRLFVKEGYSAKKSIPTFKKPVLIIHSTEDQTIPYAHGQTLFAKATGPKRFYEIKGAHIAGPVLYTDSIAAKIKALPGMK